MSHSISELMTRFEAARQKLASILEAGDDDEGRMIVDADGEMSRVFSQLLTATLDCDEDRAKRIEFLLDEIVEASDRDVMTGDLASRTSDDIRNALNAFTKRHETVSKAS